VGHLGVELEPINVPLGIANDGVGRILGLAEGTKPLGQFSDFVAVAIPDIEDGGQFGEELGLAVHGEFAGSVFAAAGPFDDPTEIVGDELHPIANPQDGDAQLKDGWIDLGSFARIDAGRSPRKNDPLGLGGADLGGFGAVGENFGIDPAFADPTGDDLGVLGAKIKNDDFVSR